MYISYGCFAIQYNGPYVLKYPLFIHNANTFDIFSFQLALAAKLTRCMHLTQIFWCIVRVGQSGSLVYIIKGFRCVFLVFSWCKYIIMKLWRAGAAPFWCKVQDECAWLYKYCLCLPFIESRQSLCADQRHLERMKSLFTLVMLTLLRVQSLTCPGG